MPLRTSWKDIGRLLLYGLLCAGSFFGAALVHWFVIPGLPVSTAVRSLINCLLILPSWFWFIWFGSMLWEKLRQILTAAQNAPYNKPAALRHCRLLPRMLPLKIQLYASLLSGNRAAHS
jgi:hypothetical protein